MALSPLPLSYCTNVHPGRSVAEVEKQRRLEDQIGAGSRAYYTRKWGGPGGQETKLQPFGSDVSFPVTLDTLRDLVIAGIPVAGHILENLRERTV